METWMIVHEPEDYDEMMTNQVFNRNMLVALDMHLLKNDEFIEICLFPVNHKFEISRTKLPFYALVKPRRSPYYINNGHERSNEIYQTVYGVTQKRYTRAYNHGFDRTSLVNLFEEWFKKLEIKEGKRLMIVTYDWPRKYQYLVNWLGPLNFKDYFSYHVRDILDLAIYFNDWALTNWTDVPFRLIHIGHIFSQLKVRDSSKDTLVRAAGMAQVYKRMVDKMIGTRF